MYIFAGCLHPIANVILSKFLKSLLLELVQTLAEIINKYNYQIATHKESLRCVGEQTGSRAPFGLAFCGSSYSLHDSTFTALVTSLLLCLADREPAVSQALNPFLSLTPTVMCYSLQLSPFVIRSAGKHSRQQSLRAETVWVCVAGNQKLPQISGVS